MTAASRAAQSDTLRVSGVTADSIVDGPGLRLAVFVQGCPHACPGCHNPGSHNPAGGTDLCITDIVAKAAANPLLSGVTLSGGEPLEQASDCLALVQALPAGLDVWLYSGYTYEEILRRADPAQLMLLDVCDVLVDGRFVMAERSLDLRFRGSGNQRLIDLNKTRAERRVVEWSPPAW